MIDCMIIGDSIAVGVSNVKRECKTYSKSGIDSRSWNRIFLHDLQPTDVLIISLGANDSKKVNTESEIRLIRNKTTAKVVYWILPIKERKPVSYESVRKVAEEFGDIVIERPKTNLSSDGIHPTKTGYRILAEKIKN